MSFASDPAREGHGFRVCEVGAAGREPYLLSEHVPDDLESLWSAVVREVFVGSDWLVMSSDVKRLEAAEVADDFAEETGTERWAAKSHIWIAGRQQHKTLGAVDFADHIVYLRRREFGSQISIQEE